MKRRSHLFLAVSGLVALSVAGLGQDQFAVSLAPPVKALWDLDRAYREATPTRERVCLNGLWRWQPAKENDETPPSSQWGYFKVPGSWPGITDYMQKDCQTLYAHPTWKEFRPGAVKAAWYQREFSVPLDWNGRRVALQLEYLNSYAVVWVDDRKAAEIRFPAGEVDLTRFCRPGQRQLLSLAVTALPLKGVMLSYGDTFGAKQIPGTVERRGLCGNVFLVGTPPGARVTNTKVSTSVRNSEISVEATLEALEPRSEYVLRAVATEQGREVKTFSSRRFTRDDLKDGRFAFASSWKPEKLWDTHTPQNTYEVSLSLLDDSGRVHDTSLPERFGFREFWIDGRDFYLNGSRILLCAVPLDSAQMGAAWANYSGTRENLQRLKSFGINFVYTHNYGCEPGTHLSFSEVLKAADDEGMLVSFSQPHFGQYDWKDSEADLRNGYARHAEFYVRAAQNHPSVVCYSMSHNSVGTIESMNPDRIDGLQDQRDRWSANNARLALRAEAIVQRLDPSRFVYHHSGANLGTLHTANFYANFAPIQEMSDWFEHWATVGVKPLFLCEYGVPISWDWMMYRGWYNGVRTFGSARVPWELCMAEWNAQFFGDQAYQLSELDKECLRWEARQFRAGQLWYRWDYPRSGATSADNDQRNAILANYLTENVRAFRTWGVSGFCPWDHGIFWKLREGVTRSRKPLPVDWENLQRPGLSPDYVDDQMAWFNVSYQREDWLPTAAAQALYRNNLPLLAYVAGKPSAFTSKDHNFCPLETIEKQLIVLNNSRETVTADCSWSLGLPQPIRGQRKVSVEPGTQSRLPLSFAPPSTTPPGQYELTAAVRFSNGEAQHDAFVIDVLPQPVSVKTAARIALFDPAGETAGLFGMLGVDCARVEANADLSNFDLLVVGKGALTPTSAAPDIRRVRDGLKVIVFEQTSETLEQRFGFRVAEYGLRQVFARVPDHPALADIRQDHLQNWRGSATLLPPRLKYDIGKRNAPEVKWCSIPVTRLWRAGNRGNVASVLIEKPACGDFLPILDGGFGLQFSQLLEYREGRGVVLFCQVDVTGRSETEPAAQILTRNLLTYLAAWKPGPRREVVYAGEAADLRHLERAGFSPRAHNGARLSPGEVLVVGPGGGKGLTRHATAVAEFAAAGGNILALGLGEDEANAFLPYKVQMRNAEHIASSFPPAGCSSFLAGVCSADVHNRDPRVIPLLSSGAVPIGNGVLGQATNTRVVFCQLAPSSFGGSEQNHLRRTYRRVSFLTSRLLANLGATASTPVLERFHAPCAGTENRWLEGLYLDKPQEWDDPYRFFCW